jgi:hypothetical protein
VTRRLSWIALAAAVLFFAAHLPFLTWFLDDIDAINFALGVRFYDIAHHQPHPPGYPLFIAIGKILTWAFAHAGWHPRGEVEAGALSFIGVLSGALAALPLVALFYRLEWNARRAVAAMLLVLASPLYWFTAARPLSDLPGLAMALAAQAILAAAFVRQAGLGAVLPAAAQPGREQAGAGSPAENKSLSPDAGETVSERGAREVADSEFRAALAASGQLIVLGAFVAGVAAGMRSQSVWLTLPLLLLVIGDRAGRGAAGAILGGTITFAVGGLLWFVPMVIATGGPTEYLHALSAQAGEDFGGVDMLYTSARPLYRLAMNLFESFVSPWVATPLAFFILVFAAIGFIAMARRARRALILILGLWVPYAILHLLFQENETIRYALPLVVPVAYLAVRGFEVVMPWRVPILAAGAIAYSLVMGVPALIAYAPTRPPVFALFQDMTQSSPAAGVPVVAMHRRVFTESRRARQWQGNAFPWTVLPAPVGHEWLEVAKYWQGGGTAPVWFMADPRRTDLALIDPASRRLVRHYAWTLERVASDPVSRQLAFSFPQLFWWPALVGGARPDVMDWYSIDRPSWFLGEGWALTPETSGIADEEQKGPGQPDGAVGYVRHRDDATRIVIGGRNLGASEGAPTVRFALDLDGRILDTWDVLPNPGFFLRQIELPAGTLSAPAGAGPAPLGTLRVRATRANGPMAHAPAGKAAAIEQFDLQPADAVIFGYDGGWLEGEYNPRTGAQWRWASDAAALRIWNGGHDVHVRLRIESPLRYFSSPPTIVLRAGRTDIKRMEPRADFTIEADVPAALLAESSGVVTLTTSEVFVPAERERGSTDRRRLGLRVYDVAVTAK